MTSLTFTWLSIVLLLASVFKNVYCNLAYGFEKATAGCKLQTVSFAAFRCRLSID